MGRLARMVAAGVEGRLLGRLGGQERKKSRFLSLKSCVLETCQPDGAQSRQVKAGNKSAWQA